MKVTADNILRELETLGTEQNRKTYRRHGIADEKLYGVSYGNLGKLKKQIKRDHELAVDLWASGNHDARVLATMIADPARVDGRLLERWAKDLSNYVLTDAFAHLAARSPPARKKAEQWMASKKEWVGSAGWLVLAMLAALDKESSDKYFEPYLAAIESDIHTSRNRVRHSMNSALIAIGQRSPALEKKAIAAAKRIGEVSVDHGETGCKTPDAVEYIRKAAKRQG